MEIRLTEDGSETCFSSRYDQCYHSMSGAVLEARERFAVPCRIAEKAGDSGRVVVLDIGFGLGYNLAAAIEAAGDAEFSSISLENDREVIDFVAGFAGPLEFKKTYPAIRILAGQGRFTSRSHDMALTFGPAEEVLAGMQPEPVFDAVFLDPFTPKANPELWSVDFFRSIANVIAPYGILSTYSSATNVKVNLLAAGFKIGRGSKVGAKGSGTLASMEAELPRFPDRDWKRLMARLKKLE